MLLPAMGMVSDMLACMCRKPVFGYKPMVYSMAAIAGLGFIVWGHHMFTSGMNPALGMTFMTSTMMIALPSAIKVFNWIGTIWDGNIKFNAVFLNCAAFVAMFVVGGLSGIFMAAVPVDIYFHDTYFIVAHFHYVLFGATLFGVFAAVQFWYPKMFGREMNDTCRSGTFALTFIGMNGTFFPMHLLGIAGMPRRYADPYLHGYLEHLLPMNQFMTISAILMGFAQFLLLGNFVLSFFFGKKAGRNPWGANGLNGQLRLLRDMVTLMFRRFATVGHTSIHLLKLRQWGRTSFCRLLHLRLAIKPLKITVTNCLPFREIFQCQFQMKQFTH
jgi:cytochrome c oxidase subunit I